MADNLQNLNDNLRLQAGIFAALNKSAGHKQKALISNNLADLEEIVLREEQLLLEVSRLDIERLLWTEQIGSKWGKLPQDLRLSELAEHFPELREVQIELEKEISRLIVAHELNNQLLQQALKIVNLTISLINQQENQTYSNPQCKNITCSRRTYLLDRSV